MRICQGDCLDVMAEMEENSVDTIITDPPYGLEFMGKDWDKGIPGPRFWREALRVAKPGAMMLAFGGTRTWHRLACAIEDAGWELRDTMMWLYGSGFPKSHDISKAIDKAAGAEREVVGKYQPPNGTKWDLRQANDDKIDHAPGTFTASGTRTLDITSPATALAAEWDGWGTALKPSFEPILLAMKPLDGTFAHNALTHGVAGLWIDGARVAIGDEYDPAKVQRQQHSEGAIKGAFGAASLIGKEIPTYNPKGRWPANLILDEEAGVLLDQQSGERAPGRGGTMRAGFQNSYVGGEATNVIKCPGYEDSGGASRYFQHCSYGPEDEEALRFCYTSKASRSERDAGLEGMEERAAQSTGWSGDGMPLLQDGTERKMPHKQNHHPTVKPISLLRYLCRLTKTPTGGVVLDPFMGSGSTGCAAVQEGRDFIGIELDAEYCEIARRRIEHWARQPVLEMV